MPKFNESFRSSSKQTGNLCYFAIIILSFLAFSVVFQAFSLSSKVEQELDSKSLVCLKQMQQNSCNPFAPATEKCKELLTCIKAADESALTEISRLALTANEQLQKTSVIPFVVVGLILIYQALKKF